MLQQQNGDDFSVHIGQISYGVKCKHPLNDVSFSLPFDFCPLFSKPKFQYIIRNNNGC